MSYKNGHQSGDLGKQVSPEYAKEVFFKSISSVERLHQKLHDILVLILKNTPYEEVSSVQALLVYNIADNKIPVGTLKSKGFYLGTNVTYNLKKLVAAGYVAQETTPHDKRSALVSLTEKGQLVWDIIDEFFNSEIDIILDICPLDFSDIETSSKVKATWDEFWQMRIEQRVKAGS